MLQNIQLFCNIFSFSVYYIVDNKQKTVFGYKGDGT